LFRRQRSYDPLTGTVSYVPFISGNSIRGQWRDLAMLRWLGLIGLEPTDIPPYRAHALLSGGVIDRGADTATINNLVRWQARDLCPAWDLFAGTIDHQLMGGRLRVGDAILV